MTEMRFKGDASAEVCAVINASVILMYSADDKIEYRFDCKNCAKQVDLNEHSVDATEKRVVTHVTACLASTYRMAECVYTVLKESLHERASSHRTRAPNFFTIKSAADFNPAYIKIMSSWPQVFEFSHRLFYNCKPSDCGERAGLMNGRAPLYEMAESLRLCKDVSHYSTVHQNAMEALAITCTNVHKDLMRNVPNFAKDGVWLLPASEIHKRRKEFQLEGILPCYNSIVNLTSESKASSFITTMLYTLPLCMADCIFKSKTHWYSERHWRLLSAAFQYGFLAGERECRLVVSLQPAWLFEQYTDDKERQDCARCSRAAVTSLDYLKQQPKSARHTIISTMEWIIAMTGLVSIFNFRTLMTPLFWAPVEDAPDITRLHYIDMTQLPYRLRLCN